jgi:hypothetical protein
MEASHLIRFIHPPVSILLSPALALAQSGSGTIASTIKDTSVWPFRLMKPPIRLNQFDGPEVE